MDVFEALADPVRRDLLAEVAVRPVRVVDLAARHPISRPAISKHLRLLSQAGLLEAAAHGRERHYRLRREPLGQVLEFVDRLMQPAEAQPAQPLTAQPPTGQPPTGQPLSDQRLDALDTEVRRTSRERRQAAGPALPGTTRPAPPSEETA
jgi:DNA-binding transcriptional ArsR family regulator